MEPFFEGSSDVTATRNNLAATMLHADGAMAGSAAMTIDEIGTTNGRLAGRVVFPAPPVVAPSKRRVSRGLGGHRAPRRHRGFTFTEVLFAVMLLGVGFIMLAGIFPVAIRQAQSSVEQTNAAAIARLAADTLRPLATLETLPVTGNEVRQLPPRRELLRGCVLTQDRRFAWTALYRRRANTNYAELIILVARVRGADQFATLPFVTGQITEQAAVEATFNWDGVNGVSTVNFIDEDGAAVEDGYVVCATPDLGDPSIVAHVGNVYRLGFRQSGNTWSLQPGAWYTGSSNLNCKVFVFGRAGALDGSTPNPFDAIPGSFSGASQAIGVYTTILPLRARTP